MRADLSRRTLLRHAAAGAAATMPGVAFTAPYGSPVDPAQLSDEDQLQNCIAGLKAILARMHPAHQTPKHQDKTSVGGTRTICITVSNGRFEGDGLYQVEYCHGRHVHVCDVRRHWCEAEQKFNLYAAPIFEGYPVGPRELIRECDIVHRVEE